MTQQINSRFEFSYGGGCRSPFQALDPLAKATLWLDGCLEWSEKSMSFLVIHMCLGDYGPETVTVSWRKRRLGVAIDDNFGDC